MFRKNRWMLILFTLLMVGITACGGKQAVATTAPATEEKKIEVQPTTTPPPEPTEKPKIACEITSDLKSDWRSVMCEQFNDNSHKWYVGSSDTSKQQAEAKIENGEYILDYSGKMWANYGMPVASRIPVIKAKDFYISIKGKIDTTNREVGWGIVFRSDETSKNGYAFRIGREHYYSLLEVVNGKWNPLTPWKTHSAISWEGDNTLEMVAEGDKFDFYVNSELVTSLSKSTISGDVVGLFVWLEEGATAVFTFDDVLVRIP